LIKSQMLYQLSYQINLFAFFSKASANISGFSR